jgi:hypothetical protein
MHVPFAKVETVSAEGMVSGDWLFFSGPETVTDGSDIDIIIDGLCVVLV